MTKSELTTIMTTAGIDVQDEGWQGVIDLYMSYENEIDQLRAAGKNNAISTIMIRRKVIKTVLEMFGVDTNRLKRERSSSVETKISRMSDDELENLRKLLDKKLGK